MYNSTRLQDSKFEPLYFLIVCLLRPIIYMSGLSLPRFLRGGWSAAGRKAGLGVVGDDWAFFFLAI